MIFNTEIEQKNKLNLWFIRLRWIAVTISYLLLLIVTVLPNYIEINSRWPLFFIISILALSNVIYTQLVKKGKYLAGIEKIQILFDLLILTILLQFSGGIENPLSFLYLIHVILSGILLAKKECYKIVFLSIALYSIITLGELYEILPHYTLLIYPHAFGTETHIEVDALDGIDKIPNNNSHTNSVVIHTSEHSQYVWSMIFLNLFIMLLTAFFITTIMEWLRNEQKETHEKYQWLHNVLQATGAGLLILNKNLKPEWINQPIINWFELHNKSNKEQNNIINEWVTKKNDFVSKTFEDATIRTIELEHIKENDEKYSFQITIAPLFDKSKKVYQVVELLQDITERKILESEIIHSSKMASIGIMASSIAHEVGNPLASISTRLKLLETNRDKDFLDKSLPLLQNEIDRIKRIVIGISQFGKQPNNVWGICDINIIINETIEILKFHKHSKLTQIITELDANLPNTLASKDQIKQIFLNLGLNALEAMKNGGSLKFNTQANKGNILITISDSGTGLDGRTKEKIFHPFFTTKEKGSGLGLFIVNHIVQAHSGTISVESEKEKGTKFMIYLPIKLPRN